MVRAPSKESVLSLVSLEYIRDMSNSQGLLDAS
jgi:hypothetical protein